MNIISDNIANDATKITETKAKNNNSDNNNINNNNNNHNSNNNDVEINLGSKWRNYDNMGGTNTVKLRSKGFQGTGFIFPID